MAIFAWVEIATKDGPRRVNIPNIDCLSGQKLWSSFRKFLIDSDRASDPSVNFAIAEVEALAASCRKQLNINGRMYNPERQSAQEAAALRAFGNLAAKIEDQTGSKFNE